MYFKRPNCKVGVVALKQKSKMAVIQELVNG